MLSNEQQKILLNIARKSVEVFLLNGRIENFKTNDKSLKEKNGAFVTIKNNKNELRGCIGIIENQNQALFELVRDMSIQAATCDNRFTSITTSELNNISFEISVLSTPKKIDNWQDIILGKHGVIIEKGIHSGVFLPQVATETGWVLEKFLNELCFQKAGLPKNSFKNDKDVILKIFEAQVFCENK